MKVKSFLRGKPGGFGVERDVSEKQRVKILSISGRTMKKVLR